MGKGRSSDKDKSKKKVSIAKRLGVSEKDIFKTMKMFYGSLAKTDCIIDTLDFVADRVEEDVVRYFFLIGIIEFTKKYYGSSDDFNWKW